MYNQNKPTASDFVHSGANSVFLNGTLDIDLPGDMASSIITMKKHRMVLKILMK